MPEPVCNQESAVATRDPGSASAPLPPVSAAQPARQHHRAAIAALVSVGVLWSSAGVLIKLVPWPPLAIWSVRSAIAALAITLVARPRLSDTTRHELAAAAALAATTALFIAANKHTTAANAILIQYSAPAWVAVLGALLLGERAGAKDWLAIAATLAGVTLFFFDRLTLEHTTGNVLALVAGVAFAAHAVLVRRVALLGQSTARAIWLGHLMAAVGGAPFVMSAGELAPSGVGALVALGVLQQAAPGLAYAWAMRRVSALEGMLIPTIEPILSPVWVWLVFSERPGRWALAGGLLVVGAITARAAASLRAAEAAVRPDDI